MMANQRLICVRRPEPSLYASFEEMYLNERLVDVTLFCSDGQIQAHKLVLAACSPYFSNLFEKLSNPFHHPVIVLKDMRIDDVRLILEFMYRGQLAVSQERMTSLLKSAENLQISGLNESNAIDFLDPNHIGDGIHNHANSGQKMKRTKKGASSSNSNNNLNQSPFNNNKSSYHSKHLGGGSENTGSGSHSEKLLQQSMLMDNDASDTNQNNQTNNHSNHSAYYGNNNADPSGSSSVRNLNSTNSQHTPSPQSSLHHLQHLPSLDSHQSGTSQQQMTGTGHMTQHAQLNNQLQVLSHSLTATRANSSGGGSTANLNNHHHNQSISSANSHHNHQLQQSHQNNHHLHDHDLDPLPSRGRLHSCHVCWKPFREKANLKRHLQIHSQDRVIYPCPDCNKTFTWKDNYIRHTKTSHHINNVRARK